MLFHDTLMNDHAHIEEILNALIEAAHADDREEVSLKWDRFEVLLLGHMDFEEMFMLPGLEHHDRRRAAEIRDEHAQIRAVLAKIGIGIDLHVVNEDHLRELKRRLSEHSKAEEVDFYRWADESLPVSTLKSLRRRLAARKAA